MRTPRHRLPELLAGLDDVPVCRLVGMAICFPPPMRPLPKRDGNGLTLHDAVDTLRSALDAHSAPCYLTMFRNFRGADRYFRKYRIVFVDREPFAFHLAISS
jgi:hypothetical protein